VRTDRAGALATLAAALVVAGLTACGSGTAAGGPAGTATPVTNGAAATVTTPPPAITPASTGQPVDAQAALLGALDRLGSTYHFVTTATVDGAVVATVEGDRVGDGARLTIRQGSTALEYVVLPEAGWVRPDGGDWDQIDAAAGTDPIAALRAPSAVALEGTPDDGAFVVVVPSAAIGVPGDAEVEVRVTVLGGSVTGLGYRATIDGRPAEVRVMIGPVVDGAPVVAPA
jgi:hypothetical protein